MENRTPEPESTYLQLRQRVLNLDPHELGISSSSTSGIVWGVMMETGYEVGSASLAVFADGTTSLYFSTGGGLLGSPEYLPVAEAAKEMVVQAEHSLGQLSPSEEIALPSAGMVRFTLLTFSGTLTAEDSEHSLTSGNQPLSGLYSAGRETLTQLRLLQDKKQV
jgi:hypothetical protein